MAFVFLEYPLCAVVMGCPVAVAKTGNHDTLTGGSVDKLVIADINAQVRNTGGVGVGEEHKIAGFQICLRNRHANVPLLFAGSVFGWASV